jgi:hypothetical protein
MRAEIKEFFDKEEAQFVKEIKAWVQNLDDFSDAEFDDCKDLYLQRIQELRDIYKLLHRLSEHLERPTSH